MDVKCFAWRDMKKIVIDGHNLIPKISGLHLQDADDEIRLIERVQAYCRLERRNAELFFDGAPDLRGNAPKHALVHVHFIKIGYSADDAILNYLRDHPKEKEFLQVVSSDHKIQMEARGMGFKITSSEEFAREMESVFRSDLAVREQKEKTLSSSEVDEWLQIFENRKNS